MKRRLQFVTVAWIIMEHVAQRYHSRDPIDHLMIAVTLRKASSQQFHRHAELLRCLGYVGFQQERQTRAWPGPSRDYMDPLLPLAGEDACHQTTRN